MKKTMMFFVALTLVLSSTAFGAKVDPTKIVVPRDSGRIVETYVSGNADAPVIAYVQDIHLNYEAQKAEAAVCESLIRDYGFDLALLEGTSKDVSIDLKKFRSEPKEVRDLAGDNLLKDGVILGINYLELTSDYNFVIQGIEDMELYKVETEDQLAVAGKADELSKLVSAMKNIASNLKLHIYTKEMRDLDDKIAAYDKDETGLVEYAKFLQGAAAANNIDVKALPNLALFIDSANLEGTIDFPAVETERKTAADAVEKALKDKAKEEFTAKNLQFRTGDISQGAFYAYLKTAAETAKVDLSAHKNLDAYTRYITTYEKIDTGLLFKEIDQLVEKTRQAMIKTPEQKKLAQVDKGLSIIADFVNTKLIPDEYNFYLQNKAEFDLKGWLAFIKDNSAKFGLTNPVPDNILILETTIPVLEKFYAAAFDRDQAFIKSIAANLAKHGKDKAILITGGFHTVNMKRLLKEQGYSYVIIAPRVDIIKDYSGLARDRMKIDLEIANQELKKAATVPTASHKAPAQGKYTLDQVTEGLKKATDALAEAKQAQDAQRIAEAELAIKGWEALQNKTGGDSIGGWKVDSAVYDSAKGVVRVTATNVKTGQTIRDREIAVTEVLDEARIKSLIKVIGAVPADMQGIVDEVISTGLARVGGNILVLEDNDLGIGGLGRGANAQRGAPENFVAITESLFQRSNPIAGVLLWHELGEAAEEANPALAGKIEAAVRAHKGNIMADNGVEMTAA
ncbi:MAG: hypothetical protein HY589_01330, partial [Candidatus Omnitrophica bacterium]|nr:hypothetical protein [Candidatus Omnitrophota bacterium]